MSLAAQGLGGASRALGRSNARLLCLALLLLSLALLLAAPATPLKIQELSFLAGAAAARQPLGSSADLTHAHTHTADAWRRLSSHSRRLQWLTAELKAIHADLGRLDVATPQTRQLQAAGRADSVAAASVWARLRGTSGGVGGDEATLLHIPATAGDGCSVALALQLLRLRAAAPARGKALIALFALGGGAGSLRQDVQSLLADETVVLGSGGLHAALSVACGAARGPPQLALGLRGSGGRYPNLDLGAAALAAAAQHRLHITVDGVPATRGTSLRGYSHRQRADICARTLLAQARPGSAAMHAPLLDLGVNAMTLTAALDGANHRAIVSAMDELLHYLDNLRHHLNLSFMLYLPCGDWLISIGSYGPALVAASLAGMLPALVLWTQLGGWAAFLTLEGKPILDRRWRLCALLFLSGVAVLAFVPYNAGLGMAVALFVVGPVGLLGHRWPVLAAALSSVCWAVLLLAPEDAADPVSPDRLARLPFDHACAAACALAVAVCLAVA